MSLNTGKLNLNIMFVEFEGDGFWCHTIFFFHNFWHAGEKMEVFWGVTAAFCFESSSWVGSAQTWPFTPLPLPLGEKKKSSLLAGLGSSYGLYMSTMGIIKIYSIQHHTLYFWPILDLVRYFSL